MSLYNYKLHSYISEEVLQENQIMQDYEGWMQETIQYRGEENTSLRFGLEAPFWKVEGLCSLMTSSIDDPFSCTNLTDSESLFRRLNNAMTSFRCSCNWSIAKKEVLLNKYPVKHTKWTQDILMVLEYFFVNSRRIHSLSVGFVAV